MEENIVVLSVKDWVSVIRDGFQILFFSVVGCLAILTYLRARKTVLQPIRTEIFKEQQRVFASLLAMFAGHGEMELRKDFGFDQALLANATLMLDTYAKHFFEVEVEQSKRPYAPERCPGRLVSEEDLEDASDYYIREQNDEERFKETPSTKDATWTEYKFNTISIPQEFAKKQQELEQIIASPLLPKQLAQLLRAYLLVAETNLVALRSVLTSCAGELPAKYPSLDDLKKASLAWISNKYNDNFKELAPEALKITEYLRGYFQVEMIMNEG